jgi:hypothetical protein
LLEWLSKLRLLRYAPQVAALCTSLADAREMGVREIEGLGLKPLEALRMTKAVQALHNVAEVGRRRWRASRHRRIDAET